MLTLCSNTENAFSDAKSIRPDIADNTADWKDVSDEDSRSEFSDAEMHSNISDKEAYEKDSSDENTTSHSKSEYEYSDDQDSLSDSLQDTRPFTDSEDTLSASESECTPKKDEVLLFATALQSALRKLLSSDADKNPSQISSRISEESTKDRFLPEQKNDTEPLSSTSTSKNSSSYSGTPKRRKRKHPNNAVDEESCGRMGRFTRRTP